MDRRVRELASLAAQGYGRLRACSPGLEDLGYTLLLGKNYARTPHGILMLGLNPGGTTNLGADAKRQCGNWLLDGIQGKRIRYWSNATRLFGRPDDLKAMMEDATYGFCCPYRTAKWSGLPNASLQALKRESAEPLTRMMTDCQPRVVILAGVASFEAFGEILGQRLMLCEALTSKCGDGRGTYQWRAWRAAFDGRSFLIAQIPHLSRASARDRLAECGHWLADILERSFGAAID